MKGVNKLNFLIRFSSARMVWEVLCTTIFGNEKKGEVCILPHRGEGRQIPSQVGICRLLEENGFAAAFPLHDGQFDLPQVEDIACFCAKKYKVLNKVFVKENPNRTDRLLQCWTDVKYSTSTGPAGAAGSSTSHWTTSGSTSERGSPSTLPGLDSTPAGSCLQLLLAWPSFFTVLSLL